MLGFWQSTPVSKLAPVLLAVARAGFTLAALSGGLLFIARAADYLNNPLVLIKFALIAAALINVWLTHRSSGWQQAIHDKPVLRSTRAFAALSLLLWLAVMLTGRLIGYR